MKNLNLINQERRLGGHDFCGVNHANQTEVQTDNLSVSGRSEVSMTLDEQPGNHPVITPLSPRNHPLLPKQKSGKSLIRIGKNVAESHVRKYAGASRVWKYAAMVVLMLCLGVGEMWGDNRVHVKKSSHIYFEPDGGTTYDWSSYSYIYFVAGDANGWRMDAIANTLLRHCKATDENWTHDNTWIRLFAAKSDWKAKNYSMGGWDNMSKDANCNNISNTWTDNDGDWYTFDNDKSYIISLSKTGSKSDLAAVSASWICDGYSGLNKSHTLKAKVSTDNGSSYSEAATLSALSATTKTFSDYTTCNTASNGSLSVGSTSSNFNSGYTAEITLTAATAPTGYTFMGWYAGSSPLSTSNGVATDRAREATTYYAYYKANQNTVTLNCNGGVDGATTSQTVTYNVAVSNIAASNLPTKSGMGFDGFWTGEGGTGTQVINASGEWQANIDGYTDSDKKWIGTSNCTLYARWLEPGYYMVGGFNSWKATTKMEFNDGIYTWETATLDPSDFYTYAPDPSRHNLTEFKIRKVVEGNGTTDVWYGGSSANIELGKSPSSSESIGSPGNNFVLQVYYDGVYTFTWTADSKIQVAVPVINQLRIYKDNGSSVSNYTDWADPSASTVTATVALERGHTYDFKVVYDSKYYGKGTGESYTTLTRGSASLNDLSTSGNDIKITADLKGNYTFSFDVSGEDLTVTYPTRRQINYSIVTRGSGTGTAGSLSATNGSDDNYSVATGGNVADGNSVTFTAPTAKSGYTWRGWFSKNNPSTWEDGKLSTDANLTYTTTVSSDLTIYAIYEEDTHEVTVAAKDNNGTANNGGSTNVSSVSGVGIATTSATITATPANLAWRFKEWEIPSGVTLASGSTTDASITIYATEDSKTITAVFEPKFGLFGSLKDNSGNAGMPGWETAIDFSVNSFESNDAMSLQAVCTLEPNTEYRFQVKDREYDVYRSGNNDATMAANASWELTGDSKQIYYKTAGYGTYTFEITKINGSNQPSIHVIRPTSYEVTYGQLSSYSNGASSDAETTGGSVRAKTTESEVDYSMNSGDSIRSGGAAIFTASPAVGYTLEGWYDNAACSGGKYVAGGNIAIEGNTLTISNITANTSAYAKFTENMTAVTFAHNEHGHVQIGEETVTNTTVGVTTKRDITAVPEDGWYFAGWTVPDGADFSVEDATGADDSYSKQTTLSGIGAGTAGTITANFVEEEKIYFRNVNASTGEKLMSDVYVYFGIWWDNNVAKTNNDDNMYEHMTEIGNTKVYWAHIPHAFTVGGGANIAFAQNEFSGNGVAMNNSIVSSRGDYNSALNMFVPYRTAKSTKSGTNYYDDGYWKVYGGAGMKAGYYVNRRTVTSTYTDPADNGTTHDNQFVIVDDNTIMYDLRIDNTNAGYYDFAISSAEGTYYNTSNSESEGTPITTSNCETGLDLHDYQTDPHFAITPTVQGIYTITIDQSSDKMKIFVNYPVAVGDYRIKHTYNDGSAHTTYSDIIKASKAGETNTVSMYLNTAITSELYLQKCTSISGSTITWSDGSDYWSTCRGKFKDGNGVYQFDVKIEDGTPSTISSLDNAGLYTGNFYIKTDCADGGWTAYKSNILEKNTINFDRAKSNTFDYYFCKWIGDARKNENSETDRDYSSGGQPTNVKFVIANDYNNAVSDTIETDAVISDGKSYQTLKWPANVRFSYNSATNEAKRTYLNGSGNYHGEYLYLEGLDSKVDMNEATDGVQATAKLTDRNNWTYYIDIKAKEGARVRLSARYGTIGGGFIQDMIGSRKAGTIGTSNTVEILGTSEPVDGTTWHDLRIIYDFKTNHLLAAWLVKDNQSVATTKEINTNVMILRQNQDDAKQISIGTGVSLSSVDTIYTALSFTKAHLTGTSGASEYARKYYWVSFPYDVKINDIFGSMGTYAVDWVLREYDGQGRAQNGYWAESASNWKFITDKNKTLQAYQGYLLQLSLPRYAAGNSKWDNSVTELSLYFPSKTKVGSIVQKNVNATLGTGNAEDYKCSIDWSGNPNGNGGTLGSAYDRTLRDSYWHCIGTPSFANETNASFKLHDGEIEGEGTWTTTNLPFLYVWDSSDNSLTPTSSSAGEFKFKALQAYLVQCNADAISWSNVSVPNSVVARRKATVEDIHFAEFKLDLMNGEKSLDHTYIRLTDKEEVTAGFEFGQDLCKEFKSGANIYTLIDQQEVAGNSLPMSEQTTVVPVGVKITTDGEYTFAMPEGSNGTGAVLVDNIAGTRTNLGLTDYTVTLGKGTYDGRFVLELSPVAQTPTGIGEVASDQVPSAKARKVLIDGIMYIVRDGEVFDARGTKVK